MGDSSFGKYRLIAELGHGGMADVFLAVQAGPVGSGFRKLTVIKRLRQNLVEEPEFVAMLVDEARIAARLNHPNVVQTNEVGQVGEQYFIAMEYLDGQPLNRMQHRSQQRAQKTGTPPLISPEQQFVVFMDTLAGLHHAHELADYNGTPLEIVHRDMSPHNVFVTYEGQVKVVDFGIAKAIGRAAETRQGIVKGKVRYMAPEQSLGRGVDRRADVFAVGIMLWEAATGRRLWQGFEDLDIVQALVAGTYPASPRSVVDTVPEGIDRICQKALARNKDDRYTTAEDFRVDLEQYLAEAGLLVQARRALPRSLDELFKDKRAEIKTVIEQQLSSLDEKTSGEFLAVSIPPASSASAPISLTRMSSGSGFSSTSATSGPASGPREPSSTNLTAQSNVTADKGTNRGRTRLLVAAAAAGLAVAVAAGGWKVMGASRASKSVASSDIAVNLNVVPATATVTIDDAAAQAVPVTARMPRDNRDHTIRIVATGYTPRIETVKFTNDLTLSVELAPAPMASTSVAAATPPPPAEKTAPSRVITIFRNVPAPKTTAATATPPPPPVAPPAPSDTKPVPPKKELDKGDPWGKQ